MNESLHDALLFLGTWFEIAGYLYTVWCMERELFSEKTPRSLTVTCLVGLIFCWPLLWIEHYASANKKQSRH